MSTAQPYACMGYDFPGQLSPVIAKQGATYSTIDVGINDAYELFWLLENFELVLTGVGTGVFSGLTIAGTITFGATESISYPSVSSTKTRTGTYYRQWSGGGYAPAEIPAARSKYYPAWFAYNAALSFRSTASSGAYNLEFFIRSLGSPSAGTVRLEYRFNFTHNAGLSIANPDYYTGTPAASGTFDLLNITLPWEGGILFGAGWIPTGSSGVGITATSSAFTF